MEFLTDDIVMVSDPKSGIHFGGCKMLDRMVKREGGGGEAEGPRGCKGKFVEGQWRKQPDISQM